MRMRILGSLLVLGLAVAGCTPPSQQYIAADGLGMYFALPVDWSRVPATQLDTAQSGWSDDAGNVTTQTILWQGAWGAGDIDANDVFAARAPQEPIAFAFVRDLIEVEQQGIGDAVAAALRDVVIPATEIKAAGGDVTTARFRQGAYSGIHQFARYTTGGADQTIEVTTVLSPGHDRLHALVIRCSSTCFERHADEIDAVFDSLTLKETRGQ